MLAQLEAKRGKLALLAKLGIRKPDPRHQIVLAQDGEDHRVDLLGLAGQWRQAVDLPRRRSRRPRTPARARRAGAPCRSSSRPPRGPARRRPRRFVAPASSAASTTRATAGRSRSLRDRRAARRPASVSIEEADRSAGETAVRCPTRQRGRLTARRLLMPRCSSAAGVGLPLHHSPRSGTVRAAPRRIALDGAG
jgi:hypothetical protein